MTYLARGHSPQTSGKKERESTYENAWIFHSYINLPEYLSASKENKKKLLRNAEGVAAQSAASPAGPTIVQELR